MANWAYREWQNQQQVQTGHVKTINRPQGIAPLLTDEEKHCSFSCRGGWRWSTCHVVRQCAAISDLQPFLPLRCREWPLAAMEPGGRKTKPTQTRVFFFFFFWTTGTKKIPLKKKKNFKIPWSWKQIKSVSVNSLPAQLWVGIIPKHYIQSFVLSPAFQCHPPLFTVLWHFTPVAHRVSLIRS